MTSYQIYSSTVVYGVIVGGNTVLEAPPVLANFVARDFSHLREYAQLKGWQIVPVVEPEKRPRFLEFNQTTYEIIWRDDVIVRITEHLKDGNNRDIRFEELPQVLKGLVHEH